MSLKVGCTSCFRALGVSSRMKIYEYLGKKRKVNVSDVVSVVKLKQPTVSYHLREMEQLGLLTSEKSGKEVYYSVSHVCPYDRQKCVLE